MYDQKAKYRRKSRLPDGAPEDCNIGPLKLRRLVPEKASGNKELVIGGKREVPDNAATELLGKKRICCHHQNGRHHEEPDNHPGGQQQGADKPTVAKPAFALLGHYQTPAQ
jgi:hypothetical protein